MTTNIYVLCELDGEIRYIGKTTQSLSKRLAQHIGDVARGLKNYKCNWVRSLLSSGYLPIIQLISEAEGDGAKEEIAWIAYGKQEGWRLVNGTEGGEGKVGCKISEETRLKLRIARARRVFTKETCRKISESNKGKIISMEQRRKSSEAQKGEKGQWYGKHLPEETKRKISEAQKGKYVSMETRRKISEAQKGKPGHPISEETKRKISLANKGKLRSEEFCIRMSKLNKGKILSKEHSQNIRNALLALHRRNSEETIQKMRDVRKEYWRRRKAS